MTTCYYRTVDFRPVAVPGWRVILLDDHQGWVSVPLAGWLIQEEVEEDGFNGDHPTGYRRAVAAFMTNDWEPESAEYRTDFWYALGPGETDPTPAQEVAHRDEQARARALQTARLRAAKDAAS